MYLSVLRNRYKSVLSLSALKWSFISLKLYYLQFLFLSALLAHIQCNSYKGMLLLYVNYYLYNNNMNKVMKEQQLNNKILLWQCVCEAKINHTHTHTVAI